jgi:hypothetical protein
MLNFMAKPKVFVWLTYLFMKQGSLFCFVLARWDLLNHVTVLHVPCSWYLQKALET